MFKEEKFERRQWFQSRLGHFNSFEEILSKFDETIGKT
jgi:hypothetical protein